MLTDSDLKGAPDDGREGAAPCPHCRAVEEEDYYAAAALAAGTSRFFVLNKLFWNNKIVMNKLL